MVDFDLPNRQVTFRRRYDVSVERVWEAFSDARELEKWWAPKPYKAETKAFDFQPGGRWLYVMGAPNGEVHFAAMEYTRIEAPTIFEAIDIFTDEDGRKIPGSPECYWRVEIKPQGAMAILEINVTGKDDGDLEKLLQMGFEEGLKKSLNNLEKLFL